MRTYVFVGTSGLPGRPAAIRSGKIRDGCSVKYIRRCKSVSAETVCGGFCALSEVIKGSRDCGRFPEFRKSGGGRTQENGRPGDGRQPGGRWNGNQEAGSRRGKAGSQEVKKRRAGRRKIGMRETGRDETVTRETGREGTGTQETGREGTGTQETGREGIRAERRGEDRPEGGKGGGWGKYFFVDSDTKREAKFSCQSNLSAVILSKRQLTGAKGRKSGKKAENFQIIIAKA